MFLIHEHFENKNLIDLTRKDIRNLSIIFQEMGMSNARVNGLMSALRSALEFCADDDDYNYEFNVGSRVRGLPKNPIREITFITEDQINWLIDELLEQEKYMLATYLALSYYSAARKMRFIRFKRRADRTILHKYCSRKRGKSLDYITIPECRNVFVYI